MLKRNDPIKTQFDVEPITGLVFRWIGCSVDILGSGQIVLGCFRSQAAALSYDARDPQTGALLPSEQRCSPMGTLQVPCQGGDFAALVMRDWPGANLSERLTAAVYAHVRAALPEFVAAEDV